MSKRLKLQLGGEAEMEERAFANPYADYQPQAAEGAPRDKAPPGDEPLPFGTDGKVRLREGRRGCPQLCQPEERRI